MKNVLLLTLLVSSISIFCMNEESGIESSQDVRERDEAELVEAFISFKPGISEMRLDKNDMLERIRAQQALIRAKSEEISAKTGRATENLYANILGENFSLISDDMSDQKRDELIKEVWDRTKEQIKQQSLAVCEEVDMAFVESVVKFNMPKDMVIQLSSEQKNGMMNLMRSSVLDSTEQNGLATLKQQVYFVRAVLATHKNTRAASTTHHSIQ